MVRLTSITTRTGDDGQTSLADGTRVSKADARIVAQGSIDELNAAVGLAAAMGAAGMAGLLQRIQNDLFDLGADITVPDSAKTEQSLRMTARHIEALEQAVAEVNGRLQPLSSFVLPGGTVAAAHLHVARTIARRAERDVWALAAEAEINPLIGQYLNRVSDLLFVMARDANDGGRGDVLWVPGGADT
ncbi:cob(I)yrinic acid a,c-diamide adenosyltransferase [Pyruvatibacter mobilis]|uniref:cob(I)yrinic acid a,c-diamide adenosyltransferase n=1 Tax=Pyruvatibacter mobilis TaxID=1712261 RepID=UPI003D125298